MPFPWLAAAVGGGALVDTIAGVASARDVNRQTSENAQQQMAFQERMSSTAHQREVNDLRLAGLNPILSAGGSGASTPSGSSAPVQAPHLPSLSSSALSVAQTAGQLKSIDAGVRATDAQTLNTQANTLETLARTPNHATARAAQAATTKLTKEQTNQVELNNRRTRDQVNAESGVAVSPYRNIEALIKLFNPLTPLAPRF